MEDIDKMPDFFSSSTLIKAGRMWLESSKYGEFQYRCEQAQIEGGIDPVMRFAVHPAFSQQKVVTTICCCPDLWFQNLSSSCSQDDS